MTNPDAPFRILAVCTGNICRSPAVERLLRHGLGRDSGVEVGSAGVGAVVGAPVADGIVAHLAAVGVSAEGFAAHQVTEQILRDSDLVLALTRRHRGRIVEEAPAVVRRAFTLREFARLAEAVGPDALPAGSAAERLAALVPLASGMRGMHPAARPEDDDVVDPWRGDAALYQRSFGELKPAVDTIVRVALGR